MLHKNSHTFPSSQSFSGTLIILAVALLVFCVVPQVQAQPSTENDLITPPRHLLPEGTFIISRNATLLPAGSTGAWVVQFTNEPGESKLPPCYLMPSRRLARLENSLARQPEIKSFSVIVSGQLFVYQNYQFLMLTATPRLNATPEKTEQTNNTTPPADQTENKQGITTTKQPETKTTPPSASTDVEKMIHELETGGPAAPIIRGNESPAAQPNKDTANDENSPQANSQAEPLREGIFINNRLVRMVRSPINGAWSIVFDSDSAGLQDPPLIILPCRLLEQMEKRAKQLGDRFQLKISGTVYLYHDGKYLLPTIMTIPYKQDNLSP